MLNWLVDWLLPSWFWYGVAGIGIAAIAVSWFVKYFPGLGPYRIPLSILGLILTVGGIYHVGASDNEAKWKEKMKELELKISAAEAQSKADNVKIVTEYVTRVQKIKEKGKTVTEYIDREVVKYDPSCIVPPEAVRAHNAAALNKSIEEIK